MDARLMCGIVGAVGLGADRVPDGALDAIRHRGPDDDGAVQVEEDAWLGHTRLSIRDLDPRSACPFSAGPVTLVYNGELWNAEAVRGLLEEEGVGPWRTTGDTEVVAQAASRWHGRAPEALEGMFAAAWHDRSDPGRVVLARDRFGEVPLHLAPVGDEVDLSRIANVPRVADGWAFASELKALSALGADSARAEWVAPGEVVHLVRLSTRRWRLLRDRYYAPPAEPVPTSTEDAGERMRGLMETAVRERSVSDVPVCTLLSGGIDSTAVALHLRESVPGLVAFTAVFKERSQDARMARLAADALGIELVEVRVPLPSAGALADVVRRIEMPFKAQVEIAWPCLHLARAMRDRGFKVCFSGEGSDELWASYGFAYHVMQRTFEGRRVFGAGQAYELGREREWCAYRRDTFVGQHRKNFPRCNKVFMAHGVECRLPFLHTPLVEFALSVPVDACVVRSPGRGPTKQKAVMYAAYDGLVPDEIVRRHKVAFQEGLGIRDPIAAVLGGRPKEHYNRWYKEAYS